MVPGCSLAVNPAVLRFFSAFPNLPFVYVLFSTFSLPSQSSLLSILWLASCVYHFSSSFFLCFGVMLSASLFVAAHLPFQCLLPLSLSVSFNSCLPCLPPLFRCTPIHPKKFSIWKRLGTLRICLTSLPAIHRKRSSSSGSTILLLRCRREIGFAKVAATAAPAVASSLRTKHS